MQLETVFDLSSLTKALATTTAIILLIREGKVRLDDRVTRFFHNFGVHGKTYITFRHLLGHYSGLAAWRPYYEEIAAIERKGRVNFMASRGAKEYVYEQIHREKLEAHWGRARSIPTSISCCWARSWSRSPESGYIAFAATGFSAAGFARDRLRRYLAGAHPAA